MIIDVTRTELTPGNHGNNCLGNGTHKNVECCCDECGYMLCCVSNDFPNIYILRGFGLSQKKSVKNNKKSADDNRQIFAYGGTINT